MRGVVPGGVGRARTRQLRQRYLRLQLDGLAAAPARDPLPGPPPHGDLNWRWQIR